MNFDALRLSPPPRRILAVKLSSFGDIVCVTPCLRALRQAFPKAEIILAVESRWADVVRRNAHLTGLIECISQVRLSPAYLWEVRRLLSKAGPFQMALDFQGTRRSAAWVYLSGAKIKAGRGKMRPGWKCAVAPDGSRHAVTVNAAVCLSLGIPAPDLHPEIYLHAEHERSLDAMLNAAGLPSSGFVVLNPFSRWPSKEWPDNQIVDVAKRIWRELGARMVISGGSDERQRGQELLRKMEPGSAVSLAGALTLGEALCLFRRASLMVSCDSGPMHAAAALRTPVVALFGPTYPERNGPWGEGHAVLQASRPSDPQFYRSAASSSHMRQLTTQAIFEAIRSVGPLRGQGR